MKLPFDFNDDSLDPGLPTDDLAQERGERTSGFADKKTSFCE